MPGRNVIKDYHEGYVYHIHNSGVGNQKIFLDDDDYHSFLHILERHLSPRQFADKRRQLYETFDGRIELLAYSLTPNSYDLLLYLEHNKATIPELIRRVATAYTMYFNKRYKRGGTIFRGVYRACAIENDRQLLLLTRHLHRKPKDYMQWQYSSLRYHIGDWRSDWVRPQRIYDLYGWGEYEAFLTDDQDYQRTLDELSVVRADR